MPHLVESRGNGAYIEWYHVLYSKSIVVFIYLFSVGLFCIVLFLALSSCKCRSRLLSFFLVFSSFLLLLSPIFNSLFSYPLLFVALPLIIEMNKGVTTL